MILTSHTLGMIRAGKARTHKHFGMIILHWLPAFYPWQEQSPELVVGSGEPMKRLVGLLVRFPYRLGILDCWAVWRELRFSEFCWGMTEDPSELWKQLSDGCSEQPPWDILGGKKPPALIGKRCLKQLLPLESNHFYLEFISRGCWTEGLISND